ncbi:MAG TPA: OmpW family outer membrane protein [Ignavibacteriaceae bacterium]|nr:OmpW family outer membrane protein [Ignavibacteriaceae bacterium]
MIFRTIIIFLFITSSLIFSQHNGKNFSLFAGVDYITTAQIFLNPNTSDIILKNKSFEITNLYSPVIDFRYKINDDLILGISSEYISKSQKGRNLLVNEGSQQLALEVDDGVEFIPIEISAYYFLPFSTNQFKFTMGAGAGYYFGKQTRKFGDTEIEKISSKTTLGILVSVGMEYLLFENLGLRFDMKFRDPEITLSNKYLNNIVNYKGSVIKLAKDTFDSKINLDGISFLIGAAFQF